MAYVPGPSITAYCDQHKLANRERLKLFRSVCLAIHHAHQKGVIHQDIKPSNVLVTEQDSALALTCSGSLPAALDYNSPAWVGKFLDEWRPRVFLTTLFTDISDPNTST
jgi:serine/threonine protein kinase